jgi:hypothetical protein
MNCPVKALLNIRKDFQINLSIRIIQIDIFLPIAA